MAHRGKQETWLQKPEWLSIPLLPGTETSRALSHTDAFLCVSVFTLPLSQADLLASSALLGRHT